MTLLDQMADDFKTMLADFGQPAVIDDNQTGERKVSILFDEPFASVNAYLGEAEMTAPVATVDSTAIKDFNGHGARLSTGGKDYTITGVQPDGSGLTRLELRGA